MQYSSLHRHPPLKAMQFFLVHPWKPTISAISNPQLQTMSGTTVLSMEGGEGEGEAVRILPADATKRKYSTHSLITHSADTDTLILLLQQNDYCTSYGTDMS